MENFELGNFEKIELLLRSKSFDELSDAEKEFVCKSLSREEYEDLFYFYQNIYQAKMHTSIEPKMEIKTALDKQFESESTKSRNPFFSRKLSILKVAAVAAVCFVLGFGISSIDNITKDKSENLTDSIIHDTVQVIKYIQQPKHKFFVKVNGENKNKTLSMDFPVLPKNYYHEKDAILFASQTMKIYNPIIIKHYR